MTDRTAINRITDAQATRAVEDFIRSDEGREAIRQAGERDRQPIDGHPDSPRVLPCYPDKPKGYNPVDEAEAANSMIGAAIVIAFTAAMVAGVWAIICEARDMIGGAM